ncbi:MAG: hypothetical protein KDI22_11025 [Gammaproteobacteria bacterium]|nr:hypothetical protein [Gammaproteobacteria bacterium]
MEFPTTGGAAQRLADSRKTPTALQAWLIISRPSNTKASAARATHKAKQTLIYATHGVRQFAHGVVAGYAVPPDSTANSP